ncbi:MAG TPA: hypothetical protein VGS03_13625 [Candidatus Polarisedimenticolia bacterium]|jgi:hypothetical protein|nr:hypothetical protein [Candidatus Polarisedimenticolia bacterium]
MLLAGAVTAPAAFASDHNISISTADETPLERCDQVKVFFGSKRHPLPTARDERSFTLKGSETRTLQMHVEGTAGMALRGSKGSDYVVTACLAAAGSTDEKARASLGGIQVAFDAGRLSLSGPEEEENDWMVYFLVQVPDGSTLDLKADNGPIGLSDVSGTIRARTHNGPLELDGCEGEIDVAAENGPVSLRAGGGRQKVSVVNGPLAIELRGTRWDGDGIEADTKNGPLSLTIPERYESGVSLEMSGNGPIHCSNGCEGAWVPGHSQNLLFGSSHPVIHITTVNGPVEIDSGTKARRQASI